MYGLAGPAIGLLNNLNLGIGISGLSVNCLRIVVLATIESNTVGAQIFFYTTGVYMFVCSYLAWLFVKNYNSDQNAKSMLEYNKASTTDLTEPDQAIEAKDNQSRA